MGGFGKLQPGFLHRNDAENGDVVDETPRSLSPVHRGGVPLPGMEAGGRALSPTPLASERSTSPHGGQALPGMADRGTSTLKPSDHTPSQSRSLSPGVAALAAGLESQIKVMSPSAMGHDRSVSPYQGQRGVALPGMENSKYVSPSLAIKPQPKHGVGAGKANKFAALRELQEEDATHLPTEEVNIGYDGSGMIVSRLAPPSVSPQPDDRASFDAFPNRPTFVNAHHVTLSIFDGLEADGLNTSEIFQHATRTLAEYGELHYVFDRKGLFHGRTTIEKLLSWKGELIHRPLHHLQGELYNDALQLFR